MSRHGVDGLRPFRCSAVAILGGCDARRLRASAVALFGCRALWLSRRLAPALSVFRTAPAENARTHSVQ
jgi:hypothetical protein